MKTCKACNKSNTLFVLHNKVVCSSCDALLIDLEIELEAENTQKPKTGSTIPADETIAVLNN
jgi:hypothetical protein